MEFVNEENKQEDITNKLHELIKKGSAKAYLSFFKKYHEADIAESLEEFNHKDVQAFFKNVKPEFSVEVLEEMRLTEQLELINDLKVELAAKIIEEMEPDDAADLIEELQETNEQKADRIINALPKKEASEIIDLLSFPEDSAGAIMTSEFLSIPENLTIEKAIQKLKKEDPPDSEISFYIYIVTKKNKLIGYTTLRNLVFESPSKTIKEIRNDNPIKVHSHTDQEDVAKMFRKYDVVALPVVDKNDILIGLITVDDIVDVVVEEATEDINKLSGISEIDEEKLISGNIFLAIFSRTPWLLLTVIGGIIASYIITTYSLLFDSSHFSLAVSLSFIPLLMGLGGNVGNQSATIIVRSLAIGTIKKEAPLKYVFRETLVGLIMGLIISGIFFIYNMSFTSHSLLFSGIVAISLASNICIAAIIGSSLPIIFKKCNIDPAIASAPFISSTLDITGQLIYFSLTFYLISVFAI
ncbi:magnesium transporter [Candidatus Marinamargulisbacteria bacterium SCGC AAA071-K20]|nr:magnesium transporter [Candidatus Marinamargulisbacteria bacterium SCGC AAA071-K20]